MKITSPLNNTAYEISPNRALSLVIENKRVFREYLNDIYAQADGNVGDIVLSKDNAPIDISKHAHVLDKFIPFDINTKHILSKMASEIEKKAMDDEHYLKTSEILSKIEKYIYDLCFSFPFNIECQKLSTTSLIKAVQPIITSDYISPLEAILEYMTLITTFDGEKLFVLVNMSSYFSLDEMNSFINDINLKQLYVMFLDSIEPPKYQNTKRVIIDSDLCEI